MKGQVPGFTVPNGLLDLRDELEQAWPAHSAALLASGMPLALYEDLSDDELRAKAHELGIEVADDADRASIEAAVEAKENSTKPPWGTDEQFNPERAWKLIQRLRSDLDKVKAERDELRAKVQEFEDATKTEQEKAAERAAQAERTARESTLEAIRLRVALKKNLTEPQAKRLVGETEEELEADADELLASFVQDDDDGQGPLHIRPRTHLRPGAVPSSEPEETDPRKLADMVRRPYS